MKKANLWLNMAIIIIISLFFITDFNAFARGGGGGGGGRGGGGFSGGSRGGGSSSSWGASKPSPSVPSKSSVSQNSASSAMKNTNSGTKTSWGSKNDTAPIQNTSTARAAAYANKNLVADKARSEAVQNTVKNTTVSDWNSARSNYSSGKNIYTPKTTPVKRSGEERQVIVNKYYNIGSRGVAYADPFNHSMMFMFSTMWWMNMWDHIDHDHYRDDPKYAELKREVEVLKAQQGSDWKPDPNYRDPGMTDAVMYSDGYLQAVKEGKITPNGLDNAAKATKEIKSEEGSSDFTGILIFFVITIIVVSAIILIIRI
jgi:hypothetical protein